MKGTLIAFGIGMLLGIVILTVNYLNNQELSDKYMEMYGYEYIDGEWKK